MLDLKFWAFWALWSAATIFGGLAGGSLWVAPLMVCVFFAGYISGMGDADRRKRLGFERARI